MCVAGGVELSQPSEHALKRKGTPALAKRARLRMESFMNYCLALFPECPLR